MSAIPSKPDSHPVSKNGGSIDPITLQLIRGSLRSARLECELIIERTAMSAFIREKKRLHCKLSGPEWAGNLRRNSGQRHYGLRVGVLPYRNHAPWGCVLVQRSLYLRRQHQPQPRTWSSSRQSSLRRNWWLTATPSRTFGTWEDPAPAASARPTPRYFTTEHWCRLSGLSTKAS